MMYESIGREGANRIDARQRRRIASFAVLLCLLMLSGTLYMAFAGTATRYAEQPGIRTLHYGDVTVDYSNASQGYVSIKHEKSSRKTKLRITYGNDMDTYDAVCDGQYYVFPLKNGSGTYGISLYGQISGSKYSQEFGGEISATMEDGLSCYLYPNQRAWYDEDSEVVRLADDLCDGLETDDEKIQACYKWVSTNVLYDYIKAMTVATGYLPDNEETIANKSGICYDFASLLGAMLRSQGIYTQIAIGYLKGNGYHAWNRVYTNGQWQLLDATYSNKYGESSYQMESVY